MTQQPVLIRASSVELRLSEAWTRLPFRYGNACLTAVPIVHVRAHVETASGRSAGGLSADCLPPRWFDKAAEKTFRENVADLLLAITCAREAYLEASASEGPRTVHRLWSTAFPEAARRIESRGLNRLTASFGSSLLERALIDAACRLAGISFHDALRDGVLGWNGAHLVAREPLRSICCRHTVGLADPIRAADVAPEERLDDGLPQTLEEDVAHYGLRHFKVKVSGDAAADRERLEAVARVLAGGCPGGYYVSLDGNEQYGDLGELEGLLDALESSAAGRQFVESIAYIEQPLRRELALDPAAGPSVRSLGRRKPVLIDESDDRLESFEEAAALGYSGCSVKNCKGVFKALRNLELARRWNLERGGAPGFFLTGEDLANLPVVPLQQDLTTLASLGIDNAERNGHHYFFGLRHLPPAEQASAAACHPDLYRRRRHGGPAEEAVLDIAGGRIQCGTLQAPGYGYSCAVAFEARVPLEEWRFERLGLAD
jgi:L-alanine-DL-glutamate epimerase-like enolase superfamily enzyme